MGTLDARSSSSSGNRSTRNSPGPVAGLSRVATDHENVKKRSARIDRADSILHLTNGNAHQDRKDLTEAALIPQSGRGLTVGERRTVPGSANEPTHDRLSSPRGGEVLGVAFQSAYDPVVQRLEAASGLTGIEPSRTAGRQVSETLKHVCCTKQELLIVDPVADLRVPVP